MILRESKDEAKVSSLNIPKCPQISLIIHQVEQLRNSN